MKKKITGLLLLICLMLSMSVLTFAFEGENATSLNENPIIRETFIALTDGLPFIAEFNPETGVISAFRDGESFGACRFYQTEEDFWKLFRINQAATDPRHRSDAPRNVTIVDFAAQTIIEYDFYGNPSVIINCAEEFENYINAPQRLSRGSVYRFNGTVFAPPTFNPRSFQGMLVGAPNQVSRGTICLHLGSAPDIFRGHAAIYSHWGDDVREFRNMTLPTLTNNTRHVPTRPGDLYNVRVSTTLFNGTAGPGTHISVLYRYNM